MCDAHSVPRMSTKQDVSATIIALAEQVAGLHDKLDDLTAAVKETDRTSSRRKEFMARHALSEGQWHALKVAGKLPRLMRTGITGFRISKQAEADWIAEREAEGMHATE
jgi:hypothetical protein